MELVPIKCKGCDGTLEVDPSLKTANCPYCGTPYIFSEARKLYLVSIQNLHADVLNMNVNSDDSAEKRLEAAETFLRMRKYGSALADFKKVCSLTPQNYQGWWGQIRAISQNFTLRIENQSQLNELCERFDDTMEVAPDTEKRALESQFHSYIQPLRQHNQQRCRDIPQELYQLEGKRQYLNNSIAGWQRAQYRESHLGAGFLTTMITLTAISAFLFIMSIVGRSPAYFFLLPALVFGGILFLGILICHKKTLKARKNTALKFRTLNDLDGQLRATNMQIFNLQQELKRLSS